MARDYRVWLKELLTSRNELLGGISDLARHLQVDRSLISQVLHLKRHLSPRHAAGVASYFRLSPRNADLLLAQMERDRSKRSEQKRYWQERVESLLRTSKDKPIQNSQAWFYSSWIHSAITQLCAVRGGQSVQALEKSLKPWMTRRQLKEALDRLVEGQYLSRQGSGRFVLNKRLEWVRTSDESVTRHHSNWRLKGLERIPFKGVEELFSTAPMMIRPRDAERVRELLDTLQKEVSLLVEGSEPEELWCLSLDWFKPLRDSG